MKPERQHRQRTLPAGEGGHGCWRRARLHGERLGEAAVMSAPEEETGSRRGECDDTA